MTAATVDAVEAARLADTLRSSAAWLRLAAERLEGSSYPEAADMARLGVLGAQDVPERIATLAEEVAS